MLSPTNLSISFSLSLHIVSNNKNLITVNIKHVVVICSNALSKSCFDELSSKTLSREFSSSTDRWPDIYGKHFTLFSSFWVKSIECEWKVNFWFCSFTQMILCAIDTMRQLNYNHSTCLFVWLKSLTFSMCFVQHQTLSWLKVKLAFERCYCRCAF